MLSSADRIIFKALEQEDGLSSCLFDVAVGRYKSISIAQQTQVHGSAQLIWQLQGRLWTPDPLAVTLDELSGYLRYSHFGPAKVLSAKNELP